MESQNNGDDNRNDDIFQDTIDWASEKSEERTRSIGIPLFYLILIALVVLIVLVFVFYYISKTTDDSEDALELMKNKKHLQDKSENYPEPEIQESENMEIDDDYPNYSDQNDQGNYSDQEYYSDQGNYSDQEYYSDQGNYSDQRNYSDQGNYSDQYNQNTE